MSKASRRDIAQAIVGKIHTKSDTVQLARAIASYLIAEGREAELESIMRDVMTLREADGLVEADVQVAHELSTQTVAELTPLVRAEFPAARSVIVDQTIQPEIVGGLRIATANEQLDLSLRGKLDTFKRLTNQGNV